MNKVNLYLFLFSVWLLLSGCRQPYDKPLEIGLPGYIVYVEDFTGYWGLTAGRFGDLVLIDGNNNVKRVLTNDRFYYDSPNLVNEASGIVFESKRAENISIRGLGAPSSIYYMDLQTLDIRPLLPSILSHFNTGSGYRTARRPHVFLPNSEFALLLNPLRGGAFASRVYLFYPDSGDFHKNEKLPHEYIGLDGLFVSPDGSIISFFSFKEYGLHLYNRDNNEIILEMSNLDSDTNRPRERCYPGMWINNHTFYYSCFTISKNLNQIFRYSLEDASSTLITEFYDEKLQISDVHITKDEKNFIFLSNRMIDDNFFADIYKYNIEKGELINLTNTANNEKGFMRYYETYEDIPEWTIW